MGLSLSLYCVGDGTGEQRRLEEKQTDSVRKEDSLHEEERWGSPHLADHENVTSCR